MVSTARSYEATNQPAQTQVGRARAISGETKAVFIIALVCMSFMAWLVVDTYKLYAVDALARTYQIATVLYNEPPKLANMGFAWPPISMLIQLPLVLIRPLAQYGITAPLSAALFAAANLALLNNILKALSQPRGLRYLILFLYQTTSIIFVYSVNGMSETILITWVLAGVYYLQQLVGRRVKDVFALTMIGVSSSMAILTRYEGVVLGAALYAVCICYWLSGRGSARTLEASRVQPERKTRIEAGSLYLLAPMAYSLGLWLFFNWLIIGDPFYFLVGIGSNAELVRANVPNSALLASLNHNLANAFQYVVSLAWHMYPGLFVALPGLAVVAAWRRNFYALGLAMLMLAFLLYQVGLLYFGQSFGFMRYIIYVIPLAAVGLALIAQELQAAGVPGWLANLGLLAMLVASSLSSYAAFSEPSIIQTQDQQYVETLRDRHVADTLAADRAVATYITSDLLKANPRAKILTDEQQAFAIVLTGNAYAPFITRRQDNFTSILEHPQGNVDYILIPKLQDGTNQIIARYPGMYDGNVPFAELVRTFPGSFVPEWRLFRVLPAGQQAPHSAVAAPQSPASPTAALTDEQPAWIADSSAWPKISEERFDQPSDRFPAVQQPTWANSYQDGHYLVRVDGRPRISYSTPLAQQNFRLAADVQIERGQAGLFFLIDQNNNFYRFLIDSEGRYRLEIQQAGASTTLLDWTESPALRRGPQAVNRIEVRRFGDQLALYANDTLLTPYTLPSGDTARSGRVGVALNAPADTNAGSAWFDNVVVYAPAQ